MRDEALFINSVQESVLQEIIDAQSHLPEQILFLQPHEGSRIKGLYEKPPTVDDPVRLYVSVGNNFSTVGCAAEIVGYDYKPDMPDQRRGVVMKIQAMLQPGEGNLVYQDAAVNLVHVRRMQRLAKPFSVELLKKVSDGEPLSPNRESPGGWSYVRRLQD